MQMNSEANSPPQPLRHISLRWREMTVLVLFALASTCFGWLVKPCWDDGWFQLCQSSGQPLQEVFGDRPLYGAYLGWLERHGILWPFHYGVHFFGWFSMGLAALTVWSLMFPSLPQLRLVAGCLSIAPVICQYQLVLVGGTVYLIQVASVFLGLFVLYWSVSTEVRVPWKWLAITGAGVLVFLNTLMTEYTIPTSLAAAVLLWFLLKGKEARRKRRLLAAVFLPAVALAGYFVFYLTADPQPRPDTRPEQVILGAGFLSLFKAAGENLANDLWQLSLGRTLTVLGDFSLHADRKDFFFVGAGIFAAISIAWASLRGDQLKLAEEKPVTRHWRGAGILLAAIVLALVPVALMGRAGNIHRMDTRFWLPVLPIAACLTVFLITNLVRERFTSAAIIALGFLCGYATASHAYREFREARGAKALGDELYRRISPEGTNVAFVVYDVPDVKKCEPIESSYELVARMTERWPTNDRNRFWAWAAPLWGNEVPNPPEDLNVTIRRVERKGVVSKYFWVSVDERGRIRRLLERTPPGDRWLISTQ